MNYLPKYHNAIYLLIIITVNLVFSQPTDETKLVIDGVLSMYDAQLSNVSQGLGIAVVEETRGSRGKVNSQESFVAKFTYKADKHRTDILKTNAGDKTHLRVMSMSTDGQIRIRYRPQEDSAYIEQYDSGMHSNWWGDDFRPTSFMNSPTFMPMKSTLKAMKTNRFKTTLEHTEEGYVKLTGHLNSKNLDNNTFDAKGTVTLVFDSDNSFRPISYVEVHRNLNGKGSSKNKSVFIEWGESGSGRGYPKSIDYKSRSVLSDERIKNGPPEGMPKEEWESYKDSDLHLRIKINEHQPDVDIDDEVFTLKGLGVSPATHIDDRIIR